MNVVQDGMGGVSGPGDAGPELERLVRAAARAVADALRDAGFDDVRAEGTTVRARAGAHRLTLRLEPRRAPSGNRERMRALLADMVVRRLLASEGEG
ncbi:MAG: hypothetical protein IRY95_01230 [Clostridia bacterium]|nr:hypothetical protein [Clostridia bacterium]